ncbi:hypothetical protein [Alkaliphilus oremlandii]|uniref:Uncharacterized protein n=1 Tax=Alkaliphilus oremlandii (strain OhILAs) TaxID=350688 RepID=A8MI19_ALKOO|nr:hypothetical protein [Alkaliphilus oremlandii]ABW19451.1 hypothetical protein Clos_1911 [Alkaliphilus oremlandii OhILAs]
MKRLYKKTISMLTIIFYMLFQNAFVFASNLQNSKIAKGFENLVKDATVVLMVLAPILGGLLIGYFFLRKAAADEMDQKTWQKRINTAIYSVVGVVVSSAAINLIIGYFA